MTVKPLSKMSREEIISGASKVLVELSRKNIGVFTYKVFATEELMVKCLNELMTTQTNDDIKRPLFTIAFVDAAATHFRLPVWWDNDRVSVNGCHVDFEEFQGDVQCAKLWATLKALNLHAT